MGSCRGFVESGESSQEMRERQIIESIEKRMVGESARKETKNICRQKMKKRGISYVLALALLLSLA